MSIRLHRPGIWQVRVYQGYDPTTGRRRLRSRHVHGTESGARRVEAEMRSGSDIVSRDAVTDVTPASDQDPMPRDEQVVDRTVADTIAAVIDHLEVVGRAPKTIAGYRCILRGIRQDEIADTQLVDLRAHDVDRYYGRLVRDGLPGDDRGGMSAARIRKYHSLIRVAAGWAVRWEWCQRNVVRDASPPTVHGGRPTAPSTEDVAAIMTQVIARDPSGVRSAAIRLLAMLGCRRGEVCALRWSDVDLDAARVTIRASRDDTPGAPVIKSTKTHQVRTIPVGAEVVELLRDHRRAMQERAMAAGAGWSTGAFVLSDAPDSSVSLRPDVLSGAWSRARKRAKVAGVTLMDLRHWAATQMIEAGLDPVVVAAILGHADPATTRRFYAASTDAGMVEAGRVLGGKLSAIG